MFTTGYPDEANKLTSSQAPSYASIETLPTDSLTGVRCRATSVAKKDFDEKMGFLQQLM